MKLQQPDQQPDLRLLVSKTSHLESDDSRTCLDKSPDLRLLVSKTKSGYIKRVSLIANKLYKEPGLTLHPGDRAELRRNITSEEMEGINSQLKDKFGERIQLRG